jgi:hypothetical protein
VIFLANLLDMHKYKWIGLSLWSLCCSPKVCCVFIAQIDLVTESEVNTLIKRIQVFCKADVCVSSILDALAFSCLSSYMVPHCFVEADVSLHWVGLFRFICTVREVAAVQSLWDEVEALPMLENPQPKALFCNKIMFVACQFD